MAKTTASKRAKQFRERKRREDPDFLKNEVKRKKELQIKKGNKLREANAKNARESRKRKGEAYKKAEAERMRDYRDKKRLPERKEIEKWRVRYQTSNIKKMKNNQINESTKNIQHPNKEEESLKLNQNENPEEPPRNAQNLNQNIFDKDGNMRRYLFNIVKNVNICQIFNSQN